MGGTALGTGTVATGNSLTVKGRVTMSAYGAYSDNGPATGNFVFIDGGTVNNNVFGGLAFDDSAKDNTVTLISGTVKNAVQGGAGSCTAPAQDCVTGNILAVQGKDFPVGGSVKNFDTLNFTLPADIAPNDAMLKVGENAAFPTFSSTDPATVTIAMAAGATLKAGESVTLIEANTKGGSYELEITPASTTVTTADGYEFKLTTEGTPTTKLVATVIKAPPPPAPTPDPTPDPTPAPSYEDSSSPTMGGLGLLLSGIALAGAAAPALRRRERRERKQD